MSNGLPEPRCYVCSPHYCRRSWIYVVYDYTKGLSKIGKSVNVSRRVSEHRKSRRTDVRLIAKYQPTCDFLITRLEMACHKCLEADRIQGDWFRVDPEVAVEVVGSVIADSASKIGQWRPGT